MRRFNPTDPGDYNFATHYIYDISGNVKKLFQENRKIGSQMIDVTKTIEYDYDLVSGKVNEVLYQPRELDQYLYKYSYDLDNKIREVQSGRDFSTLRYDARYHYYLHGPLARTELGHDIVQGIDYAYTLQGWLKAINGVHINEDGSSENYDLGEDGVPGLEREHIPADVYAYGLSYFETDYLPADDRGGGHPVTGYQFSFNSPGNPYTGYELFNGNIAATSFSSRMLNGGNVSGYSYQYDQLNRLVKMRNHEAFGRGSDWHYGTTIDDYAENVTYDANGNIKFYSRNGSSAVNLNMDELEYKYPNSQDNNLLGYVLDDKNYTPNYSVDIDEQSTDNYLYDKIGNLIHDDAGGVDIITWNVYGKIKTIYKTDGSRIYYYYDPSGNRIAKKQVPASEGSVTYTYYYRDAQGNVLGVYTQSGLEPWQWDEQHLYGSSRLGMWKPGIGMNNEVPDPYDETVIGTRHYELTNHLGNVLTVITDKKTYSGSYWEAEVLNVNDYYPFGMMMPGRKFSASESYRYGFNGKENDNEIFGNANTVNFGNRLLDVRIGRWFSTDPVVKPSITPYNFGGNNATNFIDPDGEDEIHFIVTREKYINALGVEYSKSRTVIQIIPKEGPDKFFYKEVDRVMRANYSKPKQWLEPARVLSYSLDHTEERTTQFYPNGDGPNGQGGIFKGTGITTSPGAFLFLTRNDEDYTSLAKISSPELIKYLSAKDPKMYGGLAMHSAFLALAEGIQNAINVTLALGTVGNLAITSAKEAVAARSLFLEEQKISGAHFFSRHGAQTSLQQQLTRSISGLTPDGVAKGAVNSTRFLTNEIQLEAYNLAKNAYRPGMRSTTIQMGKVAGEGYYKGGQTFSTTSEVQVYYNSSGGIITMFPNLPPR